MPGFIGMPELLSSASSCSSSSARSACPRWAARSGKGMREFKDSITGDDIARGPIRRRRQPTSPADAHARARGRLMRLPRRLEHGQARGARRSSRRAPLTAHRFGRSHRRRLRGRLRSTRADRAARVAATARQEARDLRRHRAVHDLAAGQSLVGGIALALPILLWQLWSFLAPALDPKAQRAVGVVVVRDRALCGRDRLRLQVALPAALNFLTTYDNSLYNDPDPRAGLHLVLGRGARRGRRSSSSCRRRDRDARSARASSAPVAPAPSRARLRDRRGDRGRAPRCRSGDDGPSRWCR